MATQQDAGGVPFSIAHELQQFRLLELPPEIVELIDAPNPPPLYIKSQAPSAAGTSTAKPAYAVLCTPNKTFQLRQVQTSNSLFVTKPILETAGNELPIPATCAIASCTATLELFPSMTSAAALLRDALPVYDIVAGEVDATSNGRTKGTVYEDLPMSHGECQAGWREVMAFEHEGSSYRPSPKALSQVWRSINAAALAEGIKLDSQFLTDDLTRAASEDGHPPALVEAVILHLSKDGLESSEIWSCLHQSRTVLFAGKTLLEANTGSDFLIADFTDNWEDRLPEVWRKDAQLSVVESLYEFPTETTIRAKGLSTATLDADSAPASVKPSARKWHDKFGKTRKK